MAPHVYYSHVSLSFLQPISYFAVFRDIMHNRCFIINQTQIVDLLVQLLQFTILTLLHKLIYSCMTGTYLLQTHQTILQCK